MERGYPGPRRRDAARGASPINPVIARKVLTAFARDGRRQAAPTDYELTRREREILELLVAGETLRASAERLGVSFHTIDNHVRSIYCKLHVNSRALAVAKAIQEGLV